MSPPARPQDADTRPPAAVATEIAAAIAARIAAAFAEVPPPTDDTLLHPACRDDVDVAWFYGIPDWRSLDGADIVREYAAPIAFSAEAFRYYLPAYLLWTLDNAAGPDYAAEATVRALDPGTAADMLHDFLRSRFRLIDAAQAASIVAFLERMAEIPALAEPATAALLHHWYDHAAPGP